MSYLDIDGLRISRDGPALTLKLTPGHSLGVFGPAGSGKSAFLDALTGAERPTSGAVELGLPVRIPEEPGLLRRTSPQSLAKALSGRQGATMAAEALGALGLWDDRQKPLTSLSPGQRAACRLLPVLTAGPALLAIDGELDALDPWTWPRVWELLQERLQSGSMLVLATHRAELAPQLDSLVVLRQSKLVFAGDFEGLRRAAGPTEMIVETDDQPGVRAIAAPFEVKVEQSGQNLRLTAPEGQRLAARLLVEGYGDIRAVVLREPTPAEILAKF